jgi:hypothetical protein
MAHDGSRDPTPQEEQRVRPHAAQLLLVLTIATIVSACGPSVPQLAAGSKTPSPSPSAAPWDGPPPALEAACGSTVALDATEKWLVTSDGVHLYAVMSGDGPTTLVLAHQGRSSLCGWLPYMKTANGDGMRTLAFDFRTHGESEGPEDNRLELGLDVAAAVDKAWADGADHVFLMGASMGGAAIVQNSAGLRVDGRISLSGTRLWEGFGINDPEGVASLREPFLYIGSKDDANAPLSEVDDIFGRVGSSDKRKVLLEGRSHGWSLVDDSQEGSEMRAIILQWIERHS